jgi:hypothetical protein
VGITPLPPSPSSAMHATTARHNRLVALGMPNLSLARLVVFDNGGFADPVECWHEEEFFAKWGKKDWGDVASLKICLQALIAVFIPSKQ